ncbi:MAG TPA: choice-of-anchor tandem repeat GloVer-containing protein, partial [Cyclobacteriaceae bacterium]|nr:choice-of-anchor tandem repeat GloVer-containing protein [Cyclobacteriaceae bacterium]
MRYLITQLTLPLFLLGANVYSQDNDVRIWGVSGSGTNGLAPVTNGYIFSVNPDGSDRINYKVFESSVDGARPFGKLIEGSDGFYYGTTKIGGTKNNGVIYRVKPDGTEYTKIIEFDRNTTGSDLSEIIEGSDGKLYGILRIGGKLFSVNKDGSGFYVVYNFGQNTLLSLGMTLASDGFLYGTGTFDRQNHIGSVFKVQTNGTDFQRIIDIDEANTYETKVFEGHDGMLYFAGAPSRALWRINKAGGQYEKVRVFDGKPRDVIQMPDHTIVGVFFNTLFKVDPNGDNYSSLYSFTQCDPQSLSLASNGKLYGTGDDGNQGMIFRIDANGSNISVLRSLGGFQNGVHAQSVIETSPGNFIGPALDGAAGNNGAIFTITDGGAYVKRKEFPEPNGNNPMTKLLLASDGYLYGTTENGGQNGGGTLFRISKDGSGFTRLFDFEYQYYDASSHTRTSLIEAEGYLFGARMNYVFRIAKDGTGFTKINETFPNGTVPFGNMIVGQDGVIYGLKSAFNLTGGGYVYKINTNGTGYAEILDLAPAKSTTGSFPTSIMQLANGKLVITTSEYGPSTTGAIFSMNTDGSDISIVKSNNNGSFTSVMGNAPLEASNGLLYNTTFWSTPIYSMQTDGTNYREPSTMFSGSQFVGSLIEISKKRLLGVNGWSLLSFNIETDQIMAPSLTPGIFTSAGITAVSKNVQTVTLNDISSKNMGDPAFVVSATSSLSLPITYTSSNTAVATIVNDIVTIVGAGTATIKAYQPGNITVSDASDTKTLTVFGSMPFEKSTQQITFNNLASRDVLSPPFNLEASASSGLAVSYASSNPDVATIEGTLLTIMGAGETTVTATQNGNETYKA